MVPYCQCHAKGADLPSSTFVRVGGSGFYEYAFTCCLLSLIGTTDGSNRRQLITCDPPPELMTKQLA